MGKKARTCVENAIECMNTVALAMEMVTLAVVGNRMYIQKQEIRFEMCEDVCKIVPLAIQTVTLAAFGNRKWNKKQEHVLKTL